MSKASSVTVTVFKGEPYCFSSNLKTFLTEIQEQLDKIPVEYQSTARIEIESEYYYEESHVNLEITYLRPETKEEVEKRKALEKAQSEKQKEYDLAMLAKLRQKYGERA